LLVNATRPSAPQPGEEPDGTPMPEPELRFRRLEADFELREGQAYTANLHFDGDAEILMRGRTGLLERDYEYIAWVLRGEERLPAALRRLGGATPTVAAAWLSLREWLAGPEAQRTRATLHLGGTWEQPVVETIERDPAAAAPSEDASEEQAAGRAEP